MTAGLYLIVFLDKFIGVIVGFFPRCKVVRLVNELVTMKYGRIMSEM